MTILLSLAGDFGAHLANGEDAAEYRASKIDPILNDCDELILDFTGVRSGNSSFMNALISGIVENNGEEIIRKIVFKGCNPVLRVLVESALDLGVQKLARKAA